MNILNCSVFVSSTNIRRRSNWSSCFLRTSWFLRLLLLWLSLLLIWLLLLLWLSVLRRKRSLLSSIWILLWLRYVIALFIIIWIVIFHRAWILWIIVASIIIRQRHLLLLSVILQFFGLNFKCFNCISDIPSYLSNNRLLFRRIYQLNLNVILELRCTNFISGFSVQWINGSHEEIFNPFFSCLIVFAS